MPFWALRPVMAQKQFRFGLSPQPQLAVMHWPIFGFGLERVFCVS
jgi:hypothetical protein